MEGQIKLWIQLPHRSRAEISLGPLTITQGDNGDFEWVLDQNNKVQMMTNPDQETKNRREVRSLLAQYGYAMPGSEVFTVSVGGQEQINGHDCYVIVVTNNINSDSYTMYLNGASWLLEKAVYIEDEESRDVFYGDYRSADHL